MLKMKDIAQRAGVSPSTVSVVLNDGKSGVSISDATRRRVTQAAEELGYRPSSAARAMRTGNTRMFGFLGGDLGQESVSRILAGAVEEADRSDYMMKLLPLSGQQSEPRQMIRRCAELRLMGVMALHLPLSMLEELWAEAQRYRYPVVLLDARAAIDGLPQIGSDDERGVASAVDHLVELGHRRIALICGQEQSTLSQLRASAFKRALAHHGLEARAGDVHHASFSRRDLNIAAAGALLKRPKGERPTAIFCAGDKIGAAVLQIAQELSIRVPTELSVVGFGDLALAEYAAPALTSVAQPFEEIGRVAVRQLLANGASDKSDDVPTEMLTTLPTQLITRHSTARLASVETTDKS